MSTTTRTISREDYYKVVGLLTLAAQHTATLGSLERALAEVVEEHEDAGYFGFVSDEVYDPSPDADSLLRKLKITMETE